MPRSVGLFRKAGFPVIPWPVDYRTSGKEGIGCSATMPLDFAAEDDDGRREWMGLIAYWLSGKIDQLFPGPTEGAGSIEQHRAPPRRTAAAPAR